MQAQQNPNTQRQVENEYMNGLEQLGIKKDSVVYNSISNLESFAQSNILNTLEKAEKLNAGIVNSFVTALEKKDEQKRNDILNYMGSSELETFRTVLSRPIKNEKSEVIIESAEEVKQRVDIVTSDNFLKLCESRIADSLIHCCSRYTRNSQIINVIEKLVSSDLLCDALKNEGDIVQANMYSLIYTIENNQKIGIVMGTIVSALTNKNSEQFIKKQPEAVFKKIENALKTGCDEKTFNMIMNGADLLSEPKGVEFLVNNYDEAINIIKTENGKKMLKELNIEEGSRGYNKIMQMSKEGKIDIEKFSSEYSKLDNGYRDA